MNITAINQILFPIALFVLIYSSFYIDINSLYKKNSSNKNIVRDLDKTKILHNRFSTYSSAELENFFDTVSQDDNLMFQLELIMKENNFSERIVALGHSLGYGFTITELRQSITEHTANTNSNYICLPFGCWKIS